jgi:hypothetical protein
MTLPGAGRLERQPKIDLHPGCIATVTERLRHRGQRNLAAGAVLVVDSEAPAPLGVSFQPNMDPVPAVQVVQF